MKHTPSNVEIFEQITLIRAEVAFMRERNDRTRGMFVRFVYFIITLEFLNVAMHILAFFRIR